MKKKTEEFLCFVTWLIISFVFVTLGVFMIVATFTMAARGAPPDEVAVDFATATMAKGVAPAPNPSPFDCPTCKDTGWIMHGDGHQTKCPNCDLAGLPGGPFDIIRQANELIKRGNELARRGKALLDAIERDGKITVDIHLPNAPKQPLADGQKPIVTSSDCADGQCSISSYKPTKTRKKSTWRWKR
jgi:hypothetical protein